METNVGENFCPDCKRVARVYIFTHKKNNKSVNLESSS